MKTIVLDRVFSLFVKSSAKQGNIKVGRHVWAKENHCNIEDNT